MAVQQERISTNFPALNLKKYQRREEIIGRLAQALSAQHVLDAIQLAKEDASYVFRMCAEE